MGRTLSVGSDVAHLYSVHLLKRRFLVFYEAETQSSDEVLWSRFIDSMSAIECHEMWHCALEMNQACIC